MTREQKVAAKTPFSACFNHLAILTGKYQFPSWWKVGECSVRNQTLFVAVCGLDVIVKCLFNPLTVHAGLVLDSHTYPQATFCVGRQDPWFPASRLSWKKHLLEFAWARCKWQVKAKAQGKGPCPELFEAGGAAMLIVGSRNSTWTSDGEIGCQLRFLK